MAREGRDGKVPAVADTIAHRPNWVIRVPDTGRSGGPTDLLMLLREVHGERIQAVDLLIPKMLGKQTTIDQDDTLMSLLFSLTIPSILRTR